MGNNYESLVARVARAADIAEEEVIRKVEAKRAKLSGLISKEGAAQIVAAELGISFEQERLKLSELVHGMRKANVVGKVTEILPVREYKKNDREGKIGSLQLGDATANVRVVLWDVNHIALIENEKLKVGDVVQIANASVRNNELHLSSFSDIGQSKEAVEGEVKTTETVSAGTLAEAQAGAQIATRAVIVQTFDPKYFNDKKTGDKRALLNFVLDDGTDTMRAVAFGEQINKLGLTDEEIFDVEQFGKKKADLIGEEKVFKGNFRMNTFFNRIEMTVNGVEEVDVTALLAELEAKQ